MSKATDKLFKKVERLSNEAVEWTNSNLNGRGVIIMIGEDDGNNFLLHRRSMVGGSVEILGDLLMELTMKSPTAMIPLLHTILNAAESNLKQNN